MRDSRFRRQRFNANGLAERIAILLGVAVVAGISIGLLMPKVNPTVGEMTGEYVATGSAAETLQSLTIDDQPSRAGYDRDSFGFRQTDDDGNGCDVRDDVLARDLTDVRYIAGSGSSSDSGSGSGAGCKVKSGVLSDPYTGTTIRFTRGVKTSSAVQIDHVVALENAWQSGANQWDRTKRYRFGNDMYNLLAVDGLSNQRKSDGDAATWLPANKSFRCSYVARQIGVKAKYSLWVTQAEHDAMSRVLSSCPAQTVPTGDGAESVAPQEDVSQGSSSQDGSSGEQSESGTVVEPAAPSDGDSSDVYYTNCAAVRAAGKAPLYKGQPGYSTKLDRDGDGVACE